MKQGRCLKGKRDKVQSVLPEVQADDPKYAVYHVAQFAATKPIIADGGISSGA